MIQQDAKILSHCYQNLKPTLINNNEILDIFEGNLLPYVLNSMKIQLSPRAFNTAKERVPPINVLKRVVDKLSTIYTKPPTREVVGTDMDKAMWADYMLNFVLDVKMQTANEYLNAHKACALEPYIDFELKPRLRVVPYDRFFVYSADPENPMRVTHFVKLMGTKKVDGYDVRLMYVYTDTEFYIMDENGEIQVDAMAQRQLDGTNPYGKIPFVYLNKSQNYLNPSADTDILAMTKLIPITLADVNYALMFQSFSMFYGIDLDIEKLEINPNSFINMKSDATSGNKPVFDVIKPQVDSDKAIQAIVSQLSMWLQSKNIRPGSVGNINPENMLSGVSKVVDEMDTTQERQKQIPIFKDAEHELFRLVSQHMHPIWIKTAGYGMKSMFTQGSVLSVQFPDQVLEKARSEVLKELEMEFKLGLVSKDSAMKRLNPGMSEEAIAHELMEIEKGSIIELPEDDMEEEMNGKVQSEDQD